MKKAMEGRRVHSGKPVMNGGGEEETAFMAGKRGMLTYPTQLQVGILHGR